jgi:hypothetical protein
MEVRLMRRKLLCVFLVLVTGVFAAAADFGLVLNGTGEYVSDTGGKGFGFTGIMTPWFSAALAGNLDLYFSGSLKFEHEYKTSAWAKPVLFELERTELNVRPLQTLYLTLGRQRYRDTGGMIAEGLFDGVRGSVGLGWVRISLGAFYTGFLYKESAEILMTPEDRDRYLRPLNYGDADSYFASRRVLLPLDLELSDLASRLSLALTLLAQFDVNEAPSLHTQYLALRAGIEPLDSLRFGLTGVGALAENEGAKVQANFAAGFTADWDLPGLLPDMLSAGLRWGSGAVNDRIIPFAPVNGIAQGTVFAPALPGLMNLQAAYTARFHRSFSLSAEAAAFWRTDVETFTDLELDGRSTDRFLGTELYGSLVWTPQSAIRLRAGGGVFLPGGAFVEDAGPRWKINGGIILSL